MAVARDKLARQPDAVIRPMTETDVPSVGAVERAAYQFPWSEGIFRDCVRVGYECRVATLEHAVIAYSVMSVGAGESHILNLCVAEDFRGRGIGKSLLSYMVDRAAALSVDEVFLEVRPTNATAISLYRSLGFEQVGVRRGYYQAASGREDAAVFRLGLQARRPLHS